MVDVPAATAVTVKVALDVAAATVTVEGTVATPVLLELKLKIMPPAGAFPDSVKVSVAVNPPPPAWTPIITGLGDNDMVKRVAVKFCPVTFAPLTVGLKLAGLKV